MSIKSITVVAAAAAVLLAGTCLSHAQQKSALSPEAEAALQREVKKLAAWGRDPKIVTAVLAQNARRVTPTQIQEIDAAWIAGKADDRARELLANTCSAHVKTLVAANPAYVEAFAMDDQGALVCLNQKTSDYWQGDEAKWQKSFNGGNGQVFVDKPHYDPSSRAVLVQISVPVFDGPKTVGAITVGLDPAKLATR
jgi:hypothetical protein